MPAPIATLIEQNLTNAFLSAGICKQTYENGVLVIDQTQLSDEMKKIVKAQAIGLATTWAQWQTSQVVSIPTTSVPPAPSVGFLP